MNSIDPPKWLERAKEHLRYGHLQHFTMDMLHVRLEDILTDSCFYLSAGTDITPIVAFKDVIYSYILCDEGVYSELKGIKDKFLRGLIKVKDRLIRHGFLEIQKFNLDRHFLRIRDRRTTYGQVQNPKMKNCEISFWSKDDKVYSIMYIMHDNTCAYSELYKQNGITPKAVCENRADGGYLYRGYPEESEERNALLPFPEFVLGQTCSVANASQYETLSDKVEYLGDFGDGYLCLRGRVPSKIVHETTANKSLE